MRRANVFGVSAEKAFAPLCKREFELHKEDIDTYASEITHLVSIAFSQRETKKRDESSAKSFWRGLPQSAVTKQLLAIFKRELHAQTLADALEMCRDGFEGEVHVHTIHYEQDRDKHKATYHKGKGKGKALHHPILKNKKLFNNYLRCHTCAGA
jgi:hypothetical protein